MTALAHVLQQAWLKRGALAWALRPISWLMLAVVTLRRQAYRHGLLSRHRLPVPVLVVGNRIAGGAGKTPATLAILAHLKAQGWHPGVIGIVAGRLKEKMGRPAIVIGLASILHDVGKVGTPDHILFKPGKLIA